MTQKLQNGGKFFVTSIPDSQIREESDTTSKVSNGQTTQQVKKRIKITSDAPKTVGEINERRRQRGITPDSDYTQRQIAKATSPTWQSKVADGFHALGEAAMASTPITATSYFGAKALDDVAHGNANTGTALDLGFAIMPWTRPLRVASATANQMNDSGQFLSDVGWHISNPRGVKVYHANKYGHVFDLQKARTASENNLGFHVTPDRQIAKVFDMKNKGLMEAWIPKHNMETIDIGANDYKLISNDFLLDARPV